MTVRVHLGGGQYAELEPERYEPDRSLVEDGPEPVRTLPGSRLRPKGKETHYGTQPEADPFDVEADWIERA